jgi:Uma2 family endonuclease
MAETDLHIQLILDLRSVLREFFRNAERIYVGSNLLLYYVEGDPTKSVAPDLFVVRGVGKHDRRTYQLWEEGQAPNVVIEISSRKTKDDDLKWKKQLYGWLGVREYFIFDPEYKLKPALRAYRLHNGQFVEEAVISGRVKSEELGLELVNTGKTLRLYEAQSNSFLRTATEEAAARRQMETELAQLRAELAQLKKQRGK